MAWVWVWKEIINAIEELDTCNPKWKKPTKKLTEITAGNVFATMYPEAGAIDYSNAIGLSPTNDDEGDDNLYVPDTYWKWDLTKIFG